jgi:hypothetical protein
MTKPSDRPQSVAALRSGLLGRDQPEKSRPSKPRSHVKPMTVPPQVPAKPQPKTYQAWPWLAAAAVAVVMAGSYGGTQYARMSMYKAESEAKGARRVAEAVAEKKKAFEDAAAEAQAKRDRETEEAQSREREAKLAEEERVREAAAEATRKADEERRQAEAARRANEETAARQAAEKRQAEERRQADAAAAARRAAEEAKARDARIASEEQARREAAAKKAIEDATKTREARAAAEEQARREAEAKRLATATPIRVDALFWQHDSTCQPKLIARIGLVNAPNYGKIESRTETYRAEQGRCAGTKQTATYFVYSPTTPAVTQDRLSIEVRYDKGTRTYDCVINVQDHTSQCQET